MKVNLVGRVRNTRLPPSRPLLPLFEAVINSLQAIELGETQNGHIEIRVEREAELEIDGGDGPHTAIKGFVITDNGPGFDEENFGSFETSDSTLKENLGGKGVGRLLWLKAFDSVAVDSVFIEPSGTKSRRRFVFRLDDSGVNDDQVESVPRPTPLQTVVHLRGFKSEFQEKCPKGVRTIAQKLIEHCLTYFIFGLRTTIVLRDGTGTPLDLNAVYKDEFAPHSERDKFQVGGQDFIATHLKLYSSEAGPHRLHFCAHGREVLDEKLQTSIPNLTGRVAENDGKAFFWSTFVSGVFLDSHVEAGRTDFTFPAEPTPMFPEPITIEAIRNAALPLIKSRLDPYLSPVQQRKLEKIQQYIRTKAPQYRVVAKYASGDLDNIRPDLSETDLDVELHRLSFKIEDEIRVSNARLSSACPGEEQEAERDRLIEKATDVGQANLAKYVAQRRVILDLFERSLGAGRDGKYSLENDVHRIIFPLKNTSEEVPEDQQNLWIVDERLAYHAFLASDKELRSVPVVAMDSKDRPDLIVFNNPLAFADGGPSYSSVVVVEFKRPVREQFSDEDNPIPQVYGYVAHVRNGRAKDRRGRPLLVKQETPFYCYVIGDLTPKMRQFAEEAALIAAPDGLGYFGFNPNRNAYIEVVSYDKLLQDAKKRNRVFFEKLNIPLS